MNCVFGLQLSHSGDAYRASEDMKFTLVPGGTGSLRLVTTHIAYVEGGSWCLRVSNYTNTSGVSLWGRVSSPALVSHHLGLQGFPVNRPNTATKLD